MKHRKETLAATMALASMVVPVLAEETAGVSVQRLGSQSSTIGGSDNFTGNVRVDSRFKGTEPATIGGGVVSFEPGARTNWHTHPLGQTLFVISGVGLVQHWDGNIQEIRPGDVVWIPPGIKHWHGAARTVGMSHLAFSEANEGVSVEWLEKVSDAQYSK
jgi:quercetin dioxygenase-like cupin family protein